VNQPIIDHERLISCTACGAVARTLDLVSSQSGTCLACRQPVCSFCGCTEGVPCLHPEHKYPCGWIDIGVCDFCHFEIAEANYIAVTLGPEYVKPFVDRVRQQILPGSQFESMREALRR
jgi:hypothetical protein